MTADPAASKSFYDDVIGGTSDAEPAMPGMDYRVINTADGGMVGGVMRLTDDMTQGGARPGWFFYIGVDDVDATVEKVTAEGGGVIMPHWTIEGGGRRALVRDPTGTTFFGRGGARTGTRKA